MDSLRDQVAAELRERILSGALPPGTRLRERTLSEELGVSRVPVREALLVLESQRLVDAAPRAGSVVTAVSRAVVEDLFDAREALEPLVARRAATTATAGQLDLLEQLCDRSEQAASQGDDDTAARLNVQWHQALAEASGSPLLESLLASVQVQLDRVFRRSIVGHEALMVDDHRRIVDALRRHDARLAELLALVHVTGTREASLALADDSPVADDAGTTAP